MDPTLIPFFNPQGIVVIGASSSPEKLGYGVARNIIQSGYQGTIHFVGQKPGDLFGQQIYTDLGQIPDPVDLAVLIVPPKTTPKTIEDCGKRGIKAAIILSSGFREVGEEGATLERECLESARKHGMRLLGPNCIGTIDTHLPLDTSFLQQPIPARGHIGFISQSGAFCAAMIDWAHGEGFGFSRIASLGNQVDVNETDMLSVLAEDENTHVIVLYMESVSDGRRFVGVAREVTRRKPVIGLKAGRFESGQRAAASHTGALAASDTAFEAAFEKAGILRADSAEQLFDWAQVLERYPRGLQSFRGTDSTSRNHGVAILTNAGGPGVIAADALERNGLSPAKLHESTIKALIGILPAAANIFNPVDMLASASPKTYASCLRVLLKDDSVDSVLVILPPPPMFRAEDVAEKIVEVMESDSELSEIGKPLDSKGTHKPVLITLMGSSLVEEAGLKFQRSNVITLPFPERAAAALGSLVRRTQFLTTETQRHGDIKDSHWNRVSVGNPSPEELLTAYDIPTAPMRLAHDLHEAKMIADELGYPVVLKIASPDTSHKSDVGGVALNIQNANALQIAYAQITDAVRQARPDAQIHGVHIQRLIADGQEVIAGAVRDPHFGPLMMFGSGGVEVEGLKDVSFALAPLTQAEALKMIRKTWAGRKLAGFRNLPPADEASVVDVLLRLSHLVMENESIQEIEINPLRVLGKGAIAVDVRMKQNR
jgi:acetate---CoA ligase (ADP-forming)